MGRICRPRTLRKSRSDGCSRPGRQLSIRRAFVGISRELMQLTSSSQSTMGLNHAFQVQTTDALTCYPGVNGSPPMIYDQRTPAIRAFIVHENPNIPDGPHTSLEGDPPFVNERTRLYIKGTLETLAGCLMPPCVARFTD